MKICWRIALAGVVVAGGLGLMAPQAAADDQTKTGAGNAAAVTLAKKSPMVASAYKFILAQARRIKDAELREETLDALGNRDTCILHRAHLTDAQKNAIVQSLITQGLLNPAHAMSIVGGAKAGVFPAVVDDGTSCPKLPQPFFSAPGSTSVFGHHSYPGGLVIHESNNDVADVHLALEYREVYGHGTAGPFSTIDRDDLRSFSVPEGDSDFDIFIDEDLIIGEPRVGKARSIPRECGLPTAWRSTQNTPSGFVSVVSVTEVQRASVGRSCHPEARRHRCDAFRRAQLQRGSRRFAGGAVATPGET
jgi:hypothetical protein